MQIVEKTSTVLILEVRGGFWAAFRKNDLLLFVMHCFFIGFPLFFLLMYLKYEDFVTQPLQLEHYILLIIFFLGGIFGVMIILITPIKTSCVFNKHLMYCYLKEESILESKIVKYHLSEIREAKVIIEDTGVSSITETCLLLSSGAKISLGDFDCDKITKSINQVLMMNHS
jgi:hypothetical protein